MLAFTANNKYAAGSIIEWTSSEENGPLEDAGVDSLASDLSPRKHYI